MDHSGECAFEPHSAEIRCERCGNGTGVMGTCQDLDYCDSCREYLIAEHGAQKFSEIRISLIEGREFKAKYMTSKHVIHFSIDGNPLCGQRGGPHPGTSNPDDVTCKRCAAKLLKMEML